jgi:hypothetical protein
MSFFGGYIPDTPDARDFRFEDSLLMGARVRAEASIDWSGNLDAVQSQLGNSCVGHSIASAAFLGARIDGRPIDRPSPLFSYTLARQLEGGPIRDVGCMFRYAIIGARTYGLVGNARWPERAATINTVPPLDAFIAGDEAQVGAYFRIARGDDGASIIEALRRGFCPVFGMEVDDAYMQYRGGLWTPGGSSYGGHAQVVVGYDAARVAFRVLNSWGSGWGDGGFAWIPRATLCGRYVDCWVMTVLPGAVR